MSKQNTTSAVISITAFLVFLLLLEPRREEKRRREPGWARRQTPDGVTLESDRTFWIAAQTVSACSSCSSIRYGEAAAGCSLLSSSMIALRIGRLSECFLEMPGTL